MKYKHFSKVISLLMALTMAASVSVSAFADEYYDDYYDEYGDYYEEDYGYDDYYSDDYSEEYEEDEYGSEESEESEEESQEEETSEPEPTPVPKINLNNNTENSEGTADTQGNTANLSVPDASADFYVFDAPSAIGESTRKKIIDTGTYLNSQYGAQIVVAVVNSINGTDIESYTNAMLKSWKVGGDKGYGIILLMDVNGDDYYSISGEALKSKFTSEVLQKYLDDYVEPDFAAKNYDAAALSFTDAVSSDLGTYMEGLVASGAVTVKTVENQAVNPAEEQGTEVKLDKTEKKSGGFLGFIKGLLIFVLVVIVIICAALAVIVVHGQNVKKKRAAEKRRKAEAMKKRRTGSYGTIPQDSYRSSKSRRDDYGSGSDAYHDFMNKY
ncbi:MAG: TPM domain-containing protein [Clostridia bacterium]|nr:TPM domain-containing protein [Clostridia bacterium]